MTGDADDPTQQAVFKEPWRDDGNNDSIMTGDAATMTHHNK